MRGRGIVLALLALSACSEKSPTKPPTADTKVAEAAPSAVRPRKAEYCGFGGFTVQGTGGRPAFLAKREDGEAPSAFNDTVDSAIADIAVIEGQRTASGFKVILTGGCSTGDESGFEVIVLDAEASAVRQSFFKSNPQLRNDEATYRQALPADEFTCAEGVADSLEYAEVIEQAGGGKMQLEAPLVITSDTEIVGRRQDLAIIGTSNGKTVLYCGIRYP